MFLRIDYLFESVFGIYKLPLILDYNSEEEMGIIVNNILAELSNAYDNVSIIRKEIIIDEKAIERFNELRHEINNRSKTVITTYNWDVYSENDALPLEKRISEVIETIKTGSYYPPITIGKYLGTKELPVIVLAKKQYHEKYDEPLAITLANLNERTFVIISRKEEALLEYIQTKRIPGSVYKVRIDAANTNTLTQKHAHIFDLKDNELYSVNLDGSEHDGSGGIEISKIVADYLKGKGFTINKNRIIENMTIPELQNYYYKVVEIKKDQIINKIIEA